MITERV